MVDADAEQIARRVLDAALGGDLAAAKFVLERILPPMKERPVSVAGMPTSMDDGASVNGAMAAVLRAVSAGELLPSEAQTIAALVEARRKTIETEGLERRIAALEERK